MLQFRGYNTEISSNYAVENWFDKLKYREKQLKIPLPLFLCKQAEIVQRRANMLDFLHKERLEELENKVTKRVPKSNAKKESARKSVFKQSRDADEQFRRKHENMLVNFSDPDVEKFTNKLRYHRRIAENRMPVVDESDEIWEPHRHVSMPRRMTFSFFNNMNLIVWGGVLHHPTGSYNIVNTCPTDNGMQILYTLYKICPETKAYINAMAEDGSRVNVSRLVQVLDLLSLGDDNSAELLWMKEVMQWKFAQSLHLFGSEEGQFFQYISEQYMVHSKMDCPDHQCRGYDTKQRSTMYMYFHTFEEIEDKLNNNYKSECHFCKEVVNELYGFHNNEPLPFIVLDFGHLRQAYQPQDYYQVQGVRYKLFAYTVFSTARNHFYTRFRKGNIEYEYCGLAAWTNNKLVKRMSSSKDQFNVMILIPSNGDSML